ncbi:MAG: hypothetical protein ACOCXD_03315 [Bacteroidota bacterium]
MLFGDVKSAKTNDHEPYATVSVKDTNMGTVVVVHPTYSLIPTNNYLIIA